MDSRHNDDDTPRGRRSPISAVPDEAPDPVETRDPYTRPVPNRSRAWLYVVPAAVLLVLGIAWMARVERAQPGRGGSYEVTGTSGSRANDPEGLERGDDRPLNPVAEGPSVISDMELLTSKQDYIGRAVELPAIPVMTVAGPRTFWVGRIMNRTLVLVDRKGEGLTAVKPGQIVRISGRLESPPAGEEIAKAGLSSDDREALEGERVVIRATQVARQLLQAPTDTTVGESR
jgi:hypothetical protein